MTNALNKVEAKAFEDPETGLIHEIYPVEDGKKVSFNLDGAPFKFKNFILGMSRQEETLTALFIHVPVMTSEELLQIGDLEYINLPMPKEELEKISDVMVRFDMKQEALDQFVNPQFANVKDLKQFLDIKDDIGGNVIIDFYYYNVSHIENPYEKIINFQPSLTGGDED